MPPKTIALDARYFQVIFQIIFLVYGIGWLGWNADWSHYLFSIGGCILFNYWIESVKQKRLIPFLGKVGITSWGLSITISAMSLCLLLKTNHWQISVLAAFLTVISKYIFRIHDRHIFNPSAVGIIATIFLTQDAWLSPGQWGSTAVIFFAVITLGTIVVTRVQKLDVSLAFLLTYVTLLYWRQVVMLGWPLDYFIHSISTGSLLLFSFFMISDPKTAPDHPLARIIWAMLIGLISFYLAAFKWKYNTPLWVLVTAAPLVPIFNGILKSAAFQWNHSSSHLHLSKIKHTIMKPFMKKIAACVLLAAMMGHEANAFCGFYVSKADGTLKNKTSQVILVRDGDKNVITMYNDFKGDFKDFAMVVPVPVVLKEADIKVVSQQIFQTLNDYSKPRLVEYFDENPCELARYKAFEKKDLMASVAPGMSLNKGRAMKEERVKIEAKYLVGEYDILILSAKESSALKSWLDDNGYKIPAGANEVLEPYIKSNLKFFVVKVNEKEKRKFPGDFLRPIQITFNSPKFMLPIRLGMANADGDQDMIVYAFSKQGRIECTNYRSVSLPTGKKIPLFVKNNFGNFYSNLFQRQWNREGKAVTMLEYAWDVSPVNNLKCDPCIAAAPSAQDLLQAGVWWIGRNWNDYSDEAIYENSSNSVYFTRLHVRYNRSSFPQDLQFQVTPNQENFQVRYIITHPAAGDFDCQAGKKYLKELKERRREEMEMLTWLTGKGYNDWDVVNSDVEDYIPEEASYSSLSKTTAPVDERENGILLATMGVVGLVLVGFRRKEV